MMTVDYYTSKIWIAKTKNLMMKKIKKFCGKLY